MVKFEDLWQKYDANKNDVLDSIEAKNLIRECYQLEGQEITDDAIVMLFKLMCKSNSNGLENQVSKEVMRSRIYMHFPSLKD